MHETNIVFPSGPLSLEGVVSTPQGDGIYPAVIVCHPHPLYGGSMDNNVVVSLCRALVHASFVAFRFNFRGVGKSQGDYSEGVGEQQDAEAAVSYLATMKQVDNSRLGLAGYSAGAAFGLPAGVRDARVRALAAISPPFSMSSFDFLMECPKPKLLISGSADDLVRAEDVDEFYGHCVAPKERAIVSGADHFWWGYESRLAAQVADFFARSLAADR